MYNIMYSECSTDLFSTVADFPDVSVIYASSKYATLYVLYRDGQQCK